MKRKHLIMKRVFIFFLAVVVSAGFLGGCSPKKIDNNAAQNAEKPFKISMATNFDGVEYPQPGNEVQKIIEKYTNTELNIKGYAGKTYNEILPTMIASGDLPNVIAFSHLWGMNFMVDAILQGTFWDIGPYIKQYKNLSIINPISLENSKVGGKLIGLPRIRPVVRRAFIYRKDWADALGIKEPTTIDEFYQMAKAFTKNDPDKNGKDDTYGFLMDKTAIAQFPFLFGAPNKWEAKDGKFVRDVTTPEYIEGLKFLKKLYDEKLIHPDFAIIDRNQFYNLYGEGKGGIMRDSTNACTTLDNKVKDKNPNAKTGAFIVLDGSKGKRTIGETGHNGYLMFPKSSVKTEDQLKQILAFFDKTAEKPIADLYTWGIEGVNYNLKDGKAVPILDKQKDYDDKIKFPYRYTFATYWPEDIATKGTLPPMVELANKLEAEGPKYVVADPSLALISKTNVEKGNSLELIIEDASVKFIMGKINAEQYNAEIKRWASNGGDQIAKEYYDEYKKAGGK